MRVVKLLAIAVTAVAGPIAGPVAAQSLAPMRGEVRSFTDAFAVRVYPSNPYDRPIRVEIHVYDQDFVPITDARISIGSMVLASDASRPVIVAVPFAGQDQRKVRICAESIPFPETQAKMRSQICGKFLGTRSF